MARVLAPRRTNIATSSSRAVRPRGSEGEAAELGAGGRFDSHHDITLPGRPVQWCGAQVEPAARPALHPRPGVLLVVAGGCSDGEDASGQRNRAPNHPCPQQRIVRQGSSGAVTSPPWRLPTC